MSVDRPEGIGATKFNLYGLNAPEGMNKPDSPNTVEFKEVEEREWRVAKIIADGAEKAVLIEYALSNNFDQNAPADEETISKIINGLPVDDLVKYVLKSRLLGNSDRNLNKRAYMAFKINERDEKAEESLQKTELTRKISQSEVIGELCSYIKQYMFIKFRDITFRGLELEKIMMEVFEYKREPTTVPEEYGLRKKVLELRDKLIKNKIDEAKSFAGLLQILKRLPVEVLGEFDMDHYISLFKDAAIAAKDNNFISLGHIPRHIADKVEKLASAISPTTK